MLSFLFKSNSLINTDELVNYLIKLKFYNWISSKWQYLRMINPIQYGGALCPPPYSFLNISGTTWAESIKLSDF